MSSKPDAFNRLRHVNTIHGTYHTLFDLNRVKVIAGHEDITTYQPTTQDHASETSISSWSNLGAIPKTDRESQRRSGHHRWRTGFLLALADKTLGRRRNKRVEHHHT